MVKVGNRNLSVNEARKMLTNWNRNVRESAVKGVWLMTQSKIQEIVNDFTIKGDKVKHKTKAVKWEYDLSDKGKVVPKEPKMKPKKETKMKAVKVKKVKKVKEETKKEKGLEERMKEIYDEAVSKLEVIQDDIKTMAQLKKMFGDDKQKKLDYLKDLATKYNDIVKSTTNKVKPMKEEMKKYMEDNKEGSAKLMNIALSFKVKQEQIPNAIQRRVKSIQKS